ncbi:MAG: DNA repair protein, partial [Cellvibrionaceae bacterium]|nr:DNA repair protein [Cellvibrionaceae bacterium]
DMLANRADIYNLGDILGGMDEQFALSYIENALTSNPVLAPLALREMADVYKLIDLARGANITTTDLSHQYSGAELNEITEILQKMMRIQEVVLKVNQQYIASAAQDDKYRTEPAFKLQGSYRNMNKMTEKISAVMNEAELMQMIADHYLGEAQLLTTGAEANLLKLAELRGNITSAQSERWQKIKADFQRAKAMGGDDVDTGAKVVAQLSDLVSGVESLAGIAAKLRGIEK